jgi:stearoyl-CoA desaturase (Delta-9 desaturase)
MTAAPIKKPRFGLEFTDSEGKHRWPPLITAKSPFSARILKIDTMWIGAMFTNIVVHAGGLFAIYWFWRHGFTWFDFAMITGFTFLAGLGITLGYHRLFCHKSFTAKPWVTVTLGILGSAAMQGQIRTWVSVHRKHHHHSDEAGDPHSPKSAELGFWESFKAFFDGHVGWTISGRLYNYIDYIRDMKKNREVLFVDRWYWLWVALGWIAPGLVGWAWYGTAEGYWSGLLAGGALRALFHLHTTWAVNSLGHLFGSRRFNTGDDSTNNMLVNFLSMNGEGLHNNHHAFPWSASFSLFKGEIDLGYAVLRALEKLGQVSDVKVPSRQLIDERVASFRG